MELEKHQNQTPRESLLKSDSEILYDIGIQLNILEQMAPAPWLQYYKSFLASKSISVERVAKQLNRDGEVEKLEELYKMLGKATDAKYTDNADIRISADTLTDQIQKLAA